MFILIPCDHPDYNETMRNILAGLSAGSRPLREPTAEDLALSAAVEKSLLKSIEDRRQAALAYAETVIAARAASELDAAPVRAIGGRA